MNFIDLHANITRLNKYNRHIKTASKNCKKLQHTLFKKLSNFVFHFAI